MVGYEQQTFKYGGLPHFSSIICKNVPLETELKVVIDSITKCDIEIEIKIGSLGFYRPAY